MPAAGGSTKHELELFLEDWPRRPPPSHDASGLPAFPPLSSNFLLLFHFLHPAYFSFFADNFHAQPAAHPAQLLSAARTLRLHHFFVRSILILSQSITPSSGASRPSSHTAFLSVHKPEPRVPACRLHASRIFFVQSTLSLSSAITHSSGASRPSSHQHHSYPTKAISPTSGFAGQYHTTSTKPITNTSPRRPPPSPDASWLPPFPATLPQTSTPPIPYSFLFLFFLSSTIFLFFFFFLLPFFFFPFFPFFLFFSSLYF